jgi:hypothetical protein
VQAVQGKTARFECSVEGNPKPEVQWYKGTRPLTEGPKYEMFREGDTYTLIVKDVYGEDADEYSVRATTAAGGRTSRAELTIKCK